MARRLFNQLLEMLIVERGLKLRIVVLINRTLKGVISARLLIAIYQLCNTKHEMKVKN